MEEILNSFKIAEQGGELWNKIKEKYEFKDGDLLLLLPTNNQEMNEIAAQYVPFYIENKYIEHAFILYKKEMSYLRNNTSKVTNIELSEQQMTQIVMLYKLLQFEKNIIAIIPELPFASTGMLRKKGVTIEDFVKKTFFEWVVDK